MGKILTNEEMWAILYEYGQQYSAWMKYLKDRRTD